MFRISFVLVFNTCKLLFLLKEMTGFFPNTSLFGKLIIFLQIQLRFSYPGKGNTSTFWYIFSSFHKRPRQFLQQSWVMNLHWSPGGVPLLLPNLHPILVLRSGRSSCFFVILLQNSETLLWQVRYSSNTRYQNLQNIGVLLC